MRLGAVLFLAHLLILALCFSYPLEQVGKRLRTAYLESAEEPLVDTANLMAAFVGQPMGTTVHLIIDVNGYFE